MTGLQEPRPIYTNQLYFLYANNKQIQFRITYNSIKNVNYLWITLTKYV